MNKYVFLLAAAAVCAPCWAQGSVLVYDSKVEVGIVKLPEQDFRGGARWLHEKFRAVYADDVRVRLLVTPSFSPVWAVAIKQTKADYRVAYENPLLNLPNPGTVKPPVNEVSCEAPINAALAERTIAVWSRMLTNYFPRTMKESETPSTTFSYAARRGDGEMRVDLREAAPGTPLDEFAALGKGLAIYCTSARYWAAAPVTWWNAKVLGEKLDRLEVAPKGTKPGKLAEDWWSGWSFPREDHLHVMRPPRQAVAEGDDEAVIEHVLYRDAFGPDVRARVRMVILPGGGETMAFVREARGQYQLVGLKAEQDVFMVSMDRREREWLRKNSGSAKNSFAARWTRDRAPIDPYKVRVYRKAINISPSVARELIADWKDAMVWAVPVQRGHFGHDGTTFWFSMEDETGAYAGFTRSSWGLPVLDALQQVAYDTVMECEWGATTADTWKNCNLIMAGALEHDVRALTRALKEKRR